MAVQSVDRSFISWSFLKWQFNFDDGKVKGWKDGSGGLSASETTYGEQSLILCSLLSFPLPFHRNSAVYVFRARNGLNVRKITELLGTSFPEGNGRSEVTDPRPLAYHYPPFLPPSLFATPAHLFCLQEGARRLLDRPTDPLWARRTINNPACLCFLAISDSPKTCLKKIHSHFKLAEY